jgi:hypothetical protein
LSELGEREDAGAVLAVALKEDAVEGLAALPVAK